MVDIELRKARVLFGFHFSFVAFVKSFGRSCDNTCRLDGPVLHKLYKTPS